MNTVDVMELMATWPTISRHEHGALVHTHCMLPSGPTINVFVQPSVDGFVASDHGAAFSEARASGVVPDLYIKSIRRSLETRGLQLISGQIWSPNVRRDEVPLATIQVANPTKEKAEYLVSRERVDARPSISELFPKLLLRKWGSNVVKEGIALRGKSDKLYKFDNVVILKSGIKAIFETVNHHANAINARVVTSLDIQAANPSGVSPHLVFDDRDRWLPEEIALLKTADVPTVPFTHAERYLDKLAA
jgi:hypothetical protein